MTLIDKPRAPARPAPPRRDPARPRLLVLRVLVLSLLATLVGRLWVLQVNDAATYRRAAINQQIHDIVTQPPRGEIVDDRGRPLIDNRIALVVRVNRTTLERQPDHGAAVLRRLAKVLHTSVRSLQLQLRLCGPHVGQPCWAGSPYQPIPVSQLKPSTAETRRALAILETKERFPGVSVQTQAVRHYPRPFGIQASGVLGYIGPITQAELNRLPVPQRAASIDAQVGKTGLEAAYQKYLAGKPGIKAVQVDAQGNPIGVVKNTAPRPGDILVTNLDAKVQATLEHSLRSAIQSARSQGYHADYAAGVVMNVRNGGIVAMASEPTYPPNFFDRSPVPQKEYQRLSHMPGSPLYDKAYQSANPPGSTMKMITASGLLWDHTITTSTYLDCSATFQGRHNFDGEVGGVESLHTAIVQSCDTWFYRAAYADYQHDQQLISQGKKPVEGVQHLAHLYGLGEDPGVDLPGANPGYIPDRQNTLQYWKTWLRKNACAGARRRPAGTPLQRLDAYNCKYGWKFMPGDQENEDTGQGMVTVSPLQLAVAYAAMANGGTVFEPRVAKAILSPTGKLIKRIKAPVRDHIPLPPSEMDYIRQALYGVTTESRGTAAGVFAGWPMNRVRVAGKTGTAELPHNQNDSWFASFAGPANGKPQYVTVIEVDHGYTGAASAAPAARAVWSALYGVGQHAIFPGGVAPRKIPRPTAGTAPANPAAVRTRHGLSGRRH